VPNDDPVHAIASNWSYLRTDAARDGWPAHQALIEAAYARPELSRGAVPSPRRWLAQELERPDPDAGWTV
jgi:hypothetical protein